ncbi:F-box/LRR-repeat protein 3 [Platysternon megacephalum]|uniref:F-box/LRR-repeat protein 3 n=1 Tax=Platysternon megacephalum TaxID=55544 RepID=A0A4D9DKE8_9SAUR|nr:F-box/LRR-repeat protein 3 [Platysternon megacephalum]
MQATKGKGGNAPDWPICAVDVVISKALFRNRNTCFCPHRACGPQLTGAVRAANPGSTEDWEMCLRGCLQWQGEVRGSSWSSLWCRHWRSSPGNMILAQVWVPPVTSPSPHAWADELQTPEGRNRPRGDDSPGPMPPQPPAGPQTPGLRAERTTGHWPWVPNRSSPSPSPSPGGTGLSR